MDDMMIERIHAKKMYKRRKITFFQSLINFVLTIFFLGMFLSCPLWIPKVHSLVITIISTSTSIANMVIFGVGPKCLFFVCNVIVIFLVKESKHFAPTSEKDIYDEYISRKRMSFAKTVEEEVTEGDGEGGREAEEEENNMATKELNKSVEEFIARVNQQRRNETRMLVCAA